MLSFRQLRSLPYRKIIATLAVLAIVMIPGTRQMALAQTQQSIPIPPVPGGSPSPLQFQFQIAPNTSIKELLPPPPASKSAVVPFPTDLTQVPELQFGEPLAIPADKAVGAQALQIAKISHLNGKKTDGFVKALLGNRPDLVGLPFVMGDACRMDKTRRQKFNWTVNTLRSRLSQQISVPISDAEKAPEVAAKSFWEQFRNDCWQQDRQENGVSAPQINAPLPTLPSLPPLPRPVTGSSSFSSVRQLQFVTTDDPAAKPRQQAEGRTIPQARIAVLMQVLAPMSVHMRKGLVKFLSGVSHIDATRALAEMAVFSPEQEVRDLAIEALNIRRERHYTDILHRGLRYPWLAIAKHTTEAIVKLDRQDMVPELVAMLDEPDPRHPIAKKSGGEEVFVVHELVRLNHHRSCLLCHAPGTDSVNAPEVLKAQVPVPGQPMVSANAYYSNTTPDLFVRTDVTYLRQDFSMLQPVAHAKPWPKMQRFDFLVRTRQLTEKELKTYQTAIKKQQPGLTPYQQVAHAALRQLTGRNAAPNRREWQRLLKGPARNAVLYSAD